MEQWRRRTLLIIGFVESVIFSGIVFGWANLQFILQEEGVYSHLCTRNGTDVTNSANNHDYELTDILANSTKIDTLEPDQLLLTGGNNLRVKCPEQTNTLTLIYTTAAIMYGLTSVLIGFSLDYLGFWATRFSGSAMTIIGFFCLLFTDKENPWLLWPALNLIALGSNQLKLCSYQFSNLSPSRRSTVLFAYGAAFSISATTFTLLQYLYTIGYSYQAITLPLAVLSVFTLPITLLMPKVKVEEFKEPIKTNLKIGTASPEDSVSTEETKVLNPKDKQCENDKVLDKDDKIREIPISFSLFSISAALHFFWHFANMFMILFYSLSFNSWVYKSTNDSNLVSHYTQVMGICQLTGPLFTPLTGLLTDLRIKYAQKSPDPINKLAMTIQAPAFATATSTLFLTALMTCKMFVSGPAIYTSMALVAVSRPLVHSSCVSYVRIRFPAEHFNRLYGIFTTAVAAVMFVQYPIFMWMFSSDDNYNIVSQALLWILILSLLSPGHMMITTISRHFARHQIKFSEDPGKN